jgi:hypothetical protein
VEEAARTRGLVYLRTTRGATPPLYGDEERFPIGGCKVLRSKGPEDRLTVVAAGITLHEALAAHAALERDGIAGAFHPPPRVESAVVRLVPRADPIEETDAFRRAVRACFEQRRKTLRNGLVAIVGAARADEVLSRAGIDGRRRGETLSLVEIAALASALA